MGLGRCNVELTLQDAAGRCAPQRPMARLRTLMWRDLVISLMRRFPVGLLFEGAARHRAHSPIGTVFYEIPPGRLPLGGTVRLSLRRLLRPRCS
jgi:hypothetical protein